jgi:hypothetical protein
VTPPSMRKSLPVMNAPSGPMSSAPTAHFVRSAGSSSRGDFDHLPVARAARPAEFIVGERRDDDAWADRIDPCTPLTPTHGLGHDAQ